MTNTSNDANTIAALLKRFRNERLPRAKEIKQRVENGETLTDMDMQFLETVFKDAQHIMPLADKNPEYQELVAIAIRMYHEITEQALKNEQDSKK